MGTPTRCDVAESATGNTAGVKAPRRSGSTRSSASRKGQNARPLIPCATADDNQAFGQRLSEWTDRLAPEGPVEQYLVERAVRVSWQMDCVDRHYAAMAAAACETPASNGSKALAGPTGDCLVHQLGLGQMLLNTLGTLGRLRDTNRPRREKQKRARPKLRAPKPAKGLKAARAPSKSINPSTAVDPSIVTVEELASALTMTMAAESDRPVLGSLDIARIDSPSDLGLGTAAKASSCTAGPLTRRSAHFLRRVGRAHEAMPAAPHHENRANEPNWPRRIDAEAPRIGANEPNSARRIGAEALQNGANEPNSRRRVGGYHVPLDSWDPGSKADNVPVRYRGSGRSLAGRISGQLA